MTERLYHLALEGVYRDAGAAFQDLLGWRLPAHFGVPAAEFQTLREAAGIVERSHLSRILITGTDAADVLGAVFSGHVDELEEGRAMRTVALDDEGVIRDLVLILRTGGIAYLVVGEPTQREWTVERLRAAVGADFDVRIEDRTDSTCLIGLQGPHAEGMVRQHLADGLPARVQTMHALTFQFHGFRTLAVRTSDIGEDGYLFMVAPAVALHMIETLRGAGIPLIGETAHEWARVEACVPTYQPDLVTGLTPAEADLDILLGLEAEANPRRVLAALLIEGDAVTGDKVLLQGRAAGEVRSAVRLPGRDGNYALALMEAAVALPGAQLDVAGNRASIVAKPFLRRRS